MELLKFLETLDNIDFDIGDADGETPLIYCIAKQRDEITKYLITKGVNLAHKTTKNHWTPVYVAATLGSIEILEHLISLGCDVNL